MSTPAAGTGFWYSVADAAGARITTNDMQLSPAPSDVEYPTEFLGSTQMTAEGNNIMQQPPKDSRLRGWIWAGYPARHPQYQYLWGQLVALRAKTRFAAGLSPYVYLIDANSGAFQRRVETTYTVTSATGTTVTLTGAALTTNIAANGTIEVITGTGINQMRVISSNTSNVVTVAPAYGVTPGVGATVRLRYDYSEWCKVRVVDVTRKLGTGKATATYQETRLSFVLDDATYNSF
jgi:hypothetical protein